MVMIDRYRGCLIGGAAGDALGYPIEFMGEDELFNTYGAAGIKKYVYKNGKAEISDDTRLTLFTARGLLDAVKKQKNPPNYMKSIYRCYEDWYRTQVESIEEVHEDESRNYCDLMNIPELYHRRTPIGTCLSALRTGKMGTMEKPINRSKDSGGMMRSTPVGLYADVLSKTVDPDLLGAETAAMTHGHDMGYISAAALVHIIDDIVHRDMAIRDAVDDTVESMKKLFAESPRITYFSNLMNQAVELSEKQGYDVAAILSLGEGWVAEETLAIAVYCSLKYSDDFDKAVRAAVNHRGDSNSTGAVTGSIVGAFIGYNNIPKEYTENLELKDLILETADELCCA